MAGGAGSLPGPHELQRGLDRSSVFHYDSQKRKCGGGGLCKYMIIIHTMKAKWKKLHDKSKICQHLIFIVNSLILLRIYEMSPFPDIKTCMNGQARNYVGVTTLPCWPNLDNIVVCWRHVANMRK